MLPSPQKSRAKTGYFRHRAHLVHIHLILIKRPCRGFVNVLTTRSIDRVNRQIRTPSFWDGAAAIIVDSFRSSTQEGGPVQPESPVLLAEFEDATTADLHVFDSVGFLVGDVMMSVEGGIRRARVYAGYSGWGPGQLDEEIQAWLKHGQTPELGSLGSKNPSPIKGSVSAGFGNSTSNSNRVPEPALTHF